jgi:hypothetical protein
MSTVAAIIVVVVVVALVVALALPAMRRRRLKKTFGTEYDQVLKDKGDQRSAEEELAIRQRRHQEFELRPLSEELRARYLRDWSVVQEEFVDAPKAAVGKADQLIGQIMSDRGYPSGSFEQQAADLSVEHSDVLRHYRRAHTILQHDNGDAASTEDLREAMVHYRTLFEDLVDHTTSERSK